MRKCDLLCVQVSRQACAVACSLVMWPYGTTNTTLGFCCIISVFSLTEIDSNDDDCIRTNFLAFIFLEIYSQTNTSMAAIDRKKVSAAFKLLDSKDIQAVNDFVENLRLHGRCECEMV